MPKENNKMQVDIDTLKKQNVNDLLSIKELYKRIEELGEKITQIKYIDNSLIKKLKKEYDNLKKIILDENIQVKLINDIKTINSHLNNNTNRITFLQENFLKFAFDCKCDGITNDLNSFKNAIKYCKENNITRLIIPRGTMKIESGNNTNIILPDNIILEGFGDESIIKFDDKPSIAVNGNYLFEANNCNHIEFRNLKIEGSLEDYPSSENGKIGVHSFDTNTVIFNNVTFENMRHMCTAFANVKKVIFTNNRLINSIRDGIRVNNSYNVIISNNTFINVSDDAVAVHTLDRSTIQVGSGVIISNNIFEQSQGIKCTGSKTLNIVGNVFRRCIRHAIIVRVPYEPTLENPEGGIEGDTNLNSVNISDNIINDTIGGYGENVIIQVYGEPRNKNINDKIPGVNVAPYDYNYQNNIDDSNNGLGGACSVSIVNNIITRTLPYVSKWSDWGYGKLLDRTNSTIWVDNEVNEDSFKMHGIQVKSPVFALDISNNKISGIGEMSAILLNIDKDRPNDINMFNSSQVIANIISDVQGNGIRVNNNGRTKLANDLKIFNNQFNLDPYFKATNHNSDNTWTNLSKCIPISISNAKGIVVGGNSFKNCSTTGIGNDIVSELYKNIVYSDFVSVGDNASNKGVRDIGYPTCNMIIPIDGDPTSPTYEMPIMPRVRGSAMPTTGKYAKGHFVENINPYSSTDTKGSFFVNGWKRLTNGSSHVLGTDWVEVKQYYELIKEVN